MKTVVQQIVDYLKKYDIEPNSDHIEMFEEIFEQQIVNAYIQGADDFREDKSWHNEDFYNGIEQYYNSTFNMINK